MVASANIEPVRVGSLNLIPTPLAIVVIDGLLTSTFLKLVLLPVLYEWVEKTTVPPPAARRHAAARGMSGNKPPTTGVRRRARELRERKENRIAIWTIAVTIALGAGVLIAIMLANKDADDHDGEHGGGRRGENFGAPFIQRR